MSAKLFARCTAVSSMRNLHTSSAVSSSVFAKRQKIVDPEVIKMREERMRKKMEKEIRRIKEHSKKLKPVEEMSLPIRYVRDKELRMREPVAMDEDRKEEENSIWSAHERMLIEKRNKDKIWMQKALESQRNAMLALKKFSPELYEAAIQPDPHLLTFVAHGPCLTPPIQNYNSPDGEYIDTTKTWTT